MNHGRFFLVVCLFNCVILSNHLEAMDQRYYNFNGDLTDEEALQLALQESVIPKNEKLPSAPFSEEDESLFDESPLFKEIYPTAPKEDSEDDDLELKDHKVYLSDDCAICFEKLETIPGLIGIFDCKHVFCESCIKKLIDTHKPCPFCRKTINQENIIYTYYKNLRPINSEENKKQQSNNKLSPDKKTKFLKFKKEDRQKIIMRSYKNAIRDKKDNIYDAIERICREDNNILENESIELRTKISKKIDLYNNNFKLLSDFQDKLAQTEDFHLILNLAKEIHSLKNKCHSLKDEISKLKQQLREIEKETVFNHLQSILARFKKLNEKVSSFASLTS